MARRTVAPRPGPPPSAPEHAASRVLHPIYQALDSHNWNKALKLTQSSSCADDTSRRWDIVRALRAHALERAGKRREALVLLWEVLASRVVAIGDDDDSGGGDASGGSGDGTTQGSGGNADTQAGGGADDDGALAIRAREAWSELHDRIECLTGAEDVVNDAASKKGLDGNNWLDVGLVDPARRLDRRAYAPIEPPAAGEDGASLGGGGEGGDANNSSSNNNKVSANAPTKSGGKGKGKKSKKGGASSAAAATTAKSNRASLAYYPPVTDETVLQTLAVTLRSFGLYDTMSEMYSRAVEFLSSSTVNNSDGGGLRSQEDEYGSILEEGVCVHFRAVCDCSHVGAIVDGGDGKGAETGGEEKGGDVAMLQFQLPKVETLLRAVKYYERMQTCTCY